MTAANLILAAAAGGLFGLLYFRLLWMSAQKFTGTGEVRGFVLAAFARLALVLAALGGLVALGAGPGEFVAAMLGVLAARMICTRRAPRAGTRD